MKKIRFFSSLEKNNRSADGWLNLEIAVNVSFCTAAVFRDKPYMYMNDACTPFMYMYTQFMYRRESCFQATPTVIFTGVHRCCELQGSSVVLDATAGGGVVMNESGTILRTSEWRRSYHEWPTPLRRLCTYMLATAASTLQTGQMSSRRERE